jgi:hypothetical protein
MRISAQYIYPDGGYSTGFIEKVPTIGERVTLYGILYKVAKIAVIRLPMKVDIVVYLEFISVPLGEVA